MVLLVLPVIPYRLLCKHLVWFGLTPHTRPYQTIPITKGRNHYIHSTLDQVEWMYDFLGNYIVDVTHIRPEWNGCTHVDL
jgi:hypothetical protein